LFTPKNSPSVAQRVIAYSVYLKKHRSSQLRLCFDFDLAIFGAISLHIRLVTLSQSHFIFSPGRPDCFAQWAIVYFGQLQKSPTYSGYFIPWLCLQRHKFGQIGLHFGQFFHKTIWSPCLSLPEPQTFSF
jgi:hypothetical protein